MATVTVAGACPILRGPGGQICSEISPVFISSTNVNHLTFDTCNTSVGTVVSVGCLNPQRVLSGQPNVLCQGNGAWNTTLPSCIAPTPAPSASPSGDLSLESLIIIGVVCGFAAIVLLIIITLSLVYYYKVKKIDSENGSLDLPETDFYNSYPLAKRPGSARSNVYQSEINPMYSTRLWRRGYLDVNTGYYSTPQHNDNVNHRTDHVHQRTDYAHHRIHQAPQRIDHARPLSDHTTRRADHASQRYDHGPPPPYPEGDSLSISYSSGEGPSGTQWTRPSGPPINTLIYNSIKWSPNSMKWHDNFNYLRDGRLPRYHMDERGLYKGNWPLF